MDGDHHRIVAPPPLDRATGAKSAFVPPRVPKLQQTLEPDQRHTGDEQDAVQINLPPTGKA
jgi:hypothetical protein